MRRRPTTSNGPSALPRPRRCAIYTRVSTENGLDQGRIDASHEEPALAWMRRNQHDAVHSRQHGIMQGDRPACRRLRETICRRLFRLLVIEAKQTGAARIPQQDDARVSTFPEMHETRGDIQQRELVFQPNVEADRARPLRPHRSACAKQGRNEIVQPEVLAGMHETDDR